MNQRLSLRCRIALLPVWVVWIQAVGADECPIVGHVASIEGVVEVSGTEGGTWHRVQLNEPLCQGDSVRVGELSRAAVGLVNDAVLRLDQLTTIRLTDIGARPEHQSVLQLIAGALKSFSRSPRKLAVNTPYVNGMIEGTEFTMRVDGQRTLTTVY